MAYVARGPRPQPSNPTSVFGTSALRGSIRYVDASVGTGGSGGSYASAYKTLAAAAAGDTLLLAPGAYDEATVTIPRGKNLTLIGVGARGEVGLAPSTAGVEGLLVHADDVTLINVGVAAPSGADYAIKVTGSR